MFPNDETYRSRAGDPLPERTWMNYYGIHLTRADPVDLERVEEIVEEWAVKIEQSVRCVTDVKTVRGNRGDPLGEVVVLRCMSTRDANRDLVERACEVADYNILETLYEEADA